MLSNPPQIGRQAEVVNQVYERLTNRFLEWAGPQDAIRAVFQVGSRTWTEYYSDEWADVDLVLYATEFKDYLANTDWLEAIAPVWICIPPATAGTKAEINVLFEGGYNVDFLFRPVEALSKKGLQKEPGFHHSVRLLLDRDGLAEKILAAGLDFPEPKPPSADFFNLLCNRFWFSAVYVARQIRRRELWRARKHDVLSLKAALLQMMEWHTGVKSEWQLDTWYDGRFMQHWADPRALLQVKGIFGAYNVAATSKALRASAGLFSWLAQETAQDLKYHYPHQTEERALKLIEEAIGPVIK